jgi:transposase, IS5 family
MRRQFVGIDLGREPVPDETTILNFRHLLERHKLGQPLFGGVSTHLAAHGLKVAGTIVDATIIAAPSSTENGAQARDPKMRQTRKGQQWYFGVQLHIGVDSKTKLIHAMTTTAANVHDAQVLIGTNFQHLRHWFWTQHCGCASADGWLAGNCGAAPS